MTGTKREEQIRKELDKMLEILPKLTWLTMQVFQQSDEGAALKTRYIESKVAAAMQDDIFYMQGSEIEKFGNLQYQCGWARSALKRLGMAISTGVGMLKATDKGLRATESDINKLWQERTCESWIRHILEPRIDDWVKSEVDSPDENAAQNKPPQGEQIPAKSPKEELAKLRELLVVRLRPILQKAMEQEVEVDAAKNKGQEKPWLQKKRDNIAKALESGQDLDVRDALLIMSHDRDTRFKKAMGREGAVCRNNNGHVPFSALSILRNMLIWDSHDKTLVDDDVVVSYHMARILLDALGDKEAVSDIQEYLNDLRH